MKIARIERAAGKVQAILEGGDRIEGTHLLVATGSGPMLGGLAPEVAGVSYRDTGIVVNKRLKTANRRIYAIGDAIGQSHAGNYHAGLVVRNALFRSRVKLDNDATPRLTLTDPELAQAGLTEAEARKRGMKIKNRAMALSRQRQGAGCARNPRPYQNRFVTQRYDIRRYHRRRPRRRVDRGLERGAGTKAGCARDDRCHNAVADACGNR